MTDQGPKVGRKVGMSGVAADERCSWRLGLDGLAAQPGEMPEVVVTHEVPGIVHRRERLLTGTQEIFFEDGVVAWLNLVVIETIDGYGAVVDSLQNGEQQYGFGNSLEARPLHRCLMDVHELVLVEGQRLIIVVELQDIAHVLPCLMIPVCPIAGRMPKR